jgi:hypothetical protein
MSQSKKRKNHWFLSAFRIRKINRSRVASTEQVGRTYFLEDFRSGPYFNYVTPQGGKGNFMKGRENVQICVTQLKYLPFWFAAFKYFRFLTKKMVLIIVWL